MFLPDKACPACGNEKGIKPSYSSTGRLYTADICPACFRDRERIRNIIDDIHSGKMVPEDEATKEEVFAILGRITLPYEYRAAVGMAWIIWDALEDLVAWSEWVDSEAFLTDVIRPNNANWISDYRHPFMQYSDSDGMFKYDGELKAPANFISPELLPDITDHEFDPDDIQRITLLAGIPGNDWELSDPTSDILYSYSTNDPNADFSNLAADVIGVDPEKAPEYRFILHAVYWHGHTQSELAEKLKLTQQSVGKRLEKMEQIIKRIF